MIRPHLRRTCLALVLAVSTVGCGDDTSTHVTPVSVPRPDADLLREEGLRERVDELVAAVEDSPTELAPWVAYGEFLHVSELWFVAGRALEVAAERATGAEAWRLRYLAAISASEIDPERSTAALRALVAEDPDYVPARVRLGVVLGRASGPEEALAELDEATRRDPASLDALAARGMVLTDLGRFEEAREALTRCLEREPGRNEAHAPLARCYFALGDEERAEYHADAAGRAQGAMTAKLPRHDPRSIVAATPIGPLARMDDGELALEAGRYQDAIGHFRAVAEALPTHHSAWLGWSKALFGLGLVDDARDVLERGLEHAPEASTLHDQLAGVQMTRGDLEAAAVHLDRALELRPGSPEILAHRAQLHLAQGAPKEALALADEALASDANASLAWIERARAQLALGQGLDEVRETLAGLADCTRVDALGALRLGTSMEQEVGGLEAFDAAVRGFAVRLDDPVRVGTWLGRQWLRRGKGEEAHVWLLRAAASRPEDAQLRKELARAGSLHASEILGSDHEEARTYLQHASELDPTWAFPRRLLAWSYATDARALDPQKALEIAEEALLLPEGPADPLAHDALAAALAANGRFDEARAVLAQVVEKLPPNFRARVGSVLRARLARYEVGEAFTLDPEKPLPEQR